MNLFKKYVKNTYFNIIKKCSFKRIKLGQQYQLRLQYILNKSFFKLY